MAKTKAELQADRDRHDEAMREVRAAHQEGRFCEAIELAVRAWEYVDGMMQYERRYEARSEYKNVTSIAYVLKNAPLLFDLNSLEQLAILLKSRRRIEKNTDVELAAELEEAKVQLWDAHRLWTHLDIQSAARQDELHRNLGGNQERWRSMVESWEQIGLVQRTPEGGSYRVAITTRLSETIRGKCPSCGVTGKAKKERLLEEFSCPKCQAVVHFVLLATRGP